MTEQFSVTATSLNLRSTAASDDPSNIIASLPNGQIVTRLEGTASDKWWKVTTSIGGTPSTGFVNQNFLLSLERKILVKYWVKSRKFRMIFKIESWANELTSIEELRIHHWS